MIELPGGLVVAADDHGFIVGKLRQRPDKSFAIDSPTYHTSITQAVQSALGRIMRLSVKDGGITTLRQFVEEQERLCGELQRLLTPLDSGEPRQRPVSTPLASREGTYMSQPLDGGEEA